MPFHYGAGVDMRFDPRAQPSEHIGPRGTYFLTSEEFTTLPRSGKIDPSRIRFSQKSISPDFRVTEFGTIEDLTRRLPQDIDLTNMDPIRLVIKDGQVFTLDNRRLKAFQDAGVDIPFVKLDRIPGNQLFKFTTENEGISIEVRPRRQP